MRSRNKKLIITLYFLLFIINLFAKTSALWVTPWDINTEDKVLQVIKDALEWDITDLLVEVRYRADTFYTPNKRYSDFPNPESVSYLLRENPDLDVLQCFIDHTRNSGINIHAWVTVNVITTGSTNNLPNNHLYFTNPEWLTTTSDGQAIRPNQFEGAYLDPGVEAVQTYLVNVFSDLVQNYDIYGLHLDYIRYPSIDFGYNPISVERYEYYKNDLNINSFSEWKELQIYELARKIGNNIRQIKPHINFSAAVFPDIEVAISRYSQNWYKWLDDKIIDQIYLMAYQSNNSDFFRIISAIPYDYRKNIVVGLRAWSDNGTYTIRGLRDKIALTPDHFLGLSFFSYGGIITRNYQNAIIEYNPIGTPVLFDLPISTPESFKFSGIDTDKGFFLWWDKTETSLYRKVLPSEEDYVLLGSFDTAVNFYYDLNLEPSPVYEYKLLHGNSLQSFVYKIYPNPTLHPIIADVIYDLEKIYLKITTNEDKNVFWTLEDLSSIIHSQGELKGLEDQIEISDTLLKNRFLLFKYLQNEKETTILIDLLDIKEL